MDLEQKIAKNRQLYSCEACDYETRNKFDYEKHGLTAKHLSRVSQRDVQKIAICRNSIYSCATCKKTYKSRNGLWYHEKKCAQQSKSDEQSNEFHSSKALDTSLVFELLKQNQEFKELMMEQTKQLADQQHHNQMLLEQQQTQLIEQQQQNNKLLEAVKDGKIGNTINHNTTNNNKFNLNIFLNETCKDAITMNEFINSFEVTREDFIRTGNVGFVEGISKVMMKRIQNMELHTRPLHCTDLKRETVYIKNDDKWEKDDSDKTQLRKAVKVVAHRNMNELKRWFHDSKPAVEILGTDECENYFKYYKAALGGYDKEEDKMFEEKIIKNVLKEVVIDKTT
jgi:hypothetical protein